MPFAGLDCLFQPNCVYQLQPSLRSVCTAGLTS